MRNNKIVDLLRQLKDEYGILALKAEFEAEGASFEDVILLKDYCDIVGLELTLKIGGCEAIRDIKDAQLIGVNTIVAPMIETPFALKKFVNAINLIYESQPKLFINIETITSVKNFDKIVDAEDFLNISGVVIGRNDLLNSCQYKDCNLITNMTEEIIKKTVLVGKKAVVGGNISPNSVEFLSDLKNISAFETRKVIFDSSILLNPTRSKTAISKALQLEIKLIEDKLEKSNIMYKNDIERLHILQKRLTDYSIT